MFLQPKSKWEEIVKMVKTVQKMEDEINTRLLQGYPVDTLKLNLRSYKTVLKKYMEQELEYLKKGSEG